MKYNTSFEFLFLLPKSIDETVVLKKRETKNNAFICQPVPNIKSKLSKPKDVLPNNIIVEKIINKKTLKKKC